MCADILSMDYDEVTTKIKRIGKGGIYCVIILIATTMSGPRIHTHQRTMEARMKAYQRSQLGSGCFETGD